MQLSGIVAFAQDSFRDTTNVPNMLPESINDSAAYTPSTGSEFKESTQVNIAPSLKMTAQDSIKLKKNVLKIKLDWKPNPRKAMWLALVFPGGGQIYNRKYWKLPIVYGGFVGCYYALKWNNMMYKDYSQAYLDLMDSDPNTKSYEKMIPLRYTLAGNEERFKNIFKKRKDFYRRYRDMSVFCFIGVYLLSVVDAYVDAELSNFDISKDLALKVEPSIMNNGSNTRQAYGVQCSLKF